MTDKDPHQGTPAERYKLALDMVSRVLAEPECIDYAMGRGPLTLEQLSDDAALRVTDVAERLGWPTDEDESIVPPKDYADNVFLENLFEQPSKTPLQTEEMTDEELDDVTRNERALNNFILYLRAKPIESFADAEGMEGFYGLSPVIHRAQALAPELFTALRQAVNCFDLSEQEFAKSVLARAESQDMLTALNMSYRIMGRLLKKGDLSVGVRDAHETLTA
jgi:hypothetical protein